MKRDEKDEKDQKGMAASIAAKAKHAANQAVDSLKSAKDYVAEKVANPGETIEAVKAWGAEKAQAALRRGKVQPLPLHPEKRQE